MAKITHPTEISRAQPSPYSIEIEALRFIGAVEFGSRALGVTTRAWADYDFAITREIADKVLSGKDNYNVFSIQSYFNVVPKKGNNFMIRGLRDTVNDREVDLLVLERQSDLDIVKKSVEDIKSLDKLYLSVKSNRVKAYQKALKKNGWKYKDVKTAIKLKLKGYP